MEKRLNRSGGPFHRLSIYQIESLVSLLLADIAKMLKGHKVDSEFPNKEVLLSSYDWIDKMQFDDTIYALSKLQTEINHELALNGGLDLLEAGNYSSVKYCNGSIFIT